MIHFNFGKIPDAYHSRAQRQAVLYRINRMVPKNSDQIYGQTISALKLWRFRVDELLADEQISRVTHTFCGNCQPTFIQSQPKTRCCRIRWLCPFCYARAVGDIWTSLESVLISETSAGLLESNVPVTGRRLILDISQECLLDRYDLISIQKTHCLGVLPNTEIRWYPSANARTADWLYYTMRRNATSYRNVYKRQPHAAGLFRISTISIQDEEYHLVNKELWLVDKGEECGVEDSSNCFRYTSMDRKALLRVVTWFCGYSGALLTSTYDQFLPVWQMYTGQVAPYGPDGSHLTKPKHSNNMSRYGLFRQRKKNGGFDY